jgi:polar amino acid transport system substrate-binding protein
VTVDGQAPAAVLAPTGTLRAAYLGTNPVHARRDPKTGEAAGPVPDLVAELGRVLNVTAVAVPAPDAAGVIAALKGGTADIGFLAYEETRARDVDYGPAFIVMHSSYLVRSESPFATSAEVDRTGVTVAAIKGTSQEVFVSRTMKNARVRVLDVMPPQPELESLLLGKGIDAFAINRQRSLDAQATSGGKLRPLPDSFLDLDQCFVVPKGDTAKLKAVEQFAARLRQTDFMTASIERARLAGVSPARK